jgi:hypothetical protein
MRIVVVASKTAYKNKSCPRGSLLVISSSSSSCELIMTTTETEVKTKEDIRLPSIKGRLAQAISSDIITLSSVDDVVQQLEVVATADIVLATLDDVHRATPEKIATDSITLSSIEDNAPKIEIAGANVQMEETTTTHENDNKRKAPSADEEDSDGDAENNHHKRRRRFMGELPRLYPARYSTSERPRRNSVNLPSRLWNTVFCCVEHPDGIFIDKHGQARPDVSVRLPKFKNVRLLTDIERQTLSKAERQEQRNLRYDALVKSESGDPSDDEYDPDADDDEEEEDDEEYEEDDDEVDEDEEEDEDEDDEDDEDFVEDDDDEEDDDEEVDDDIDVAEDDDDDDEDGEVANDDNTVADDDNEVVEPDAVLGKGDNEDVDNDDKEEQQQEADSTVFDGDELK